ncbi:hypothetical protein V6N11_072866, partial [Hibiscus sabdariffa]
QYAWTLGLRKVLVETDSREVLDIIKHQSDALAGFVPLWQRYLTCCLEIGLFRLGILAENEIR